MTARQLSASLGLPHKFLEAILTDLQRGVILTSRRGVGGGFGLARPADEVSLDNVIEALVGAVAEVRGQIPETAVYLGPAENLRAAWIAVRSNLRLSLEAITIADIVSGDLSPLFSAASGASQALAVDGARVRQSSSASAKLNARLADAGDSTEGRYVDTPLTVQAEEIAAPSEH
jgi:Rrf2 family protein